MNQRLYPPPTLEELTAELRRRIAANRKVADESKRDGWKTQEKVCERTARELERLVAWIEG